MTDIDINDPYDRQLQDVLDGALKIDQLGGLNPITDELLRSCQRPHVVSLVQILKVSPTRCAGDLTPCGLGKTPCGMAVANELKLSGDSAGAIVICPLLVMPKWRYWALKFKINVLIVNYETLKNGKVYSQILTTNKNKERKRVASTFLLPIKNKSGETVDFEWRVPSDILVVFDEAHVCGNPSSLNGKLMLAIRGKARTLLLSGTLANNAEQFLTFGYMFGMYKSLDVGRTQIGKDMEKGLNNILIPKYASAIRLSKKDKENMFASTIDIETYALHDKVAARIEELWAFYAKSGDNMKRQHRIKRIIEQYLVLALEERINNCIKAGNSVILYLNYRKSVAHAAELFNTTCIIEGGQEPEDRARSIRRFQANKEPIIVCNTRAGGVGLDLHDRIGDSKRFLFLRPGSQAKETKQALERPNRLTAMSESHRFLIFADTPFERRWRDRMSTNIAFLDRLNDTDLSPLAVKLGEK